MNRLITVIRVLVVGFVLWVLMPLAFIADVFKCITKGKSLKGIFPEYTKTLREFQNTAIQAVLNS